MLSSSRKGRDRPAAQDSPPTLPVGLSSDRGREGGGGDKLISEFWVNSAQIQPLPESKFNRPLLYDVFSSVRRETIPAGDSLLCSPEGTEFDIRYFGSTPPPGVCDSEGPLLLTPKQGGYCPLFVDTIPSFFFPVATYRDRGHVNDHTTAPTRARNPPCKLPNSRAGDI